MVGNFVKRGILIVPIFLLALLVLFPQGSGFYFPTLKFEVPIMESSFNDLGLFVRNESMNLDFNLTFDYPLPLGEDESVITAEIWRGGELVDTKTIPLKEYLEQYKIINNDRYIFKPIFFNYSASVMAINATYNATEFDYSVTQYRRAPFENEGVAEGTRNKWKVQGRVIQDSYSGLTINNRYCSGPWDFEGDGVTTVNTGAGSVAVPNIGVPGTTTLYRQGEARTCNRQAGVENCKRGGDSCVEQSECCSGICSMFLCSMSGLNDDCTCVGNPPQCGEGSNMYACSENSVYQNPCCLERGTIGFVCDDGKCVMEEYALVVNRQSWDEDSNGNTWWTTPTQDNAILYFEIGDIESIKDTDPPAAPLISLEWASAHAWKFETYVRPTQEVLRTKAFRMYPDDGARFVYYKLQGNEWNIREQNWSCLTGMFDNSNGVGNGCPLHISLSPAILSRPQDGWYKLEFYLYNDPWGRSKGGEGDEDGNSFGLRVEDFQTKGNSLLQVLGTGSIINSEPPGSHDVNIAGSATVYANQGLVEIRDFRKFSTSHRSPGCDGSVICSMREACGNSEYKPYPNEPGLVTNKYGWILHHRIYPDSWEDVGGVSTRKKGYITTTGSPSGKPINFDENSIGNRRNEYAYLMYGPQNATKNIGGIYRCKDEWPSWEVECGNSANRYSYRKGSETVKCCYVSSDVGSNEDQTVTINHFSGYNYIINFLPPFGNSGDKLCAAVSNAGFFGWPVEMYRSNYTNQYCDEETGKGCCYCRPGWGCRLDCINELNMTGDEFSLPFAASGAFWELKDVRIDLSGTHLQSVIELTSTGGVTEGWEISAAVGEFADVVLDKNYTIPFNLFEDFGMKAPEDRGMYTLVLKINYTVEDDDRTVIPFNYMFSSVDCTKDGKSGNYYDSYTYPSTKGKGACQPGLRECIRLTDNDYRWQYSTLDDMPVYPTTETCNGIDDDCDGVIDDINSFEWVIDQIIASGGKKTPYEVTQCGCFMGAASSHEICNGVDDNCDGTVDDPEVNLWINTCDDAVKECMLEGSPYDWCRRLYNSTQCSLDQVTISTRANYSVNTCTAQVRDCMDNIHLYYVGDDYLNTNNLTYDECKYMYDDYSCFLDVQLFTTLGGTCRCTTSTPINETCNGIDDDCNGMIDDTESIQTCGCSLIRDIEKIDELKGITDNSCDGSDSDCDGVIDDEAVDCACTRRTPSEVVEIKESVVEICDGIDNDCDGVKDENFPQTGKPCGYGMCVGGNYVCNVHGDEAVCNTTVNPDETFSGFALKRNDNEICDLKDNDCDYSIDEDCSCTPENAVRLCGYESGIYYNNREQLDQTCEKVMTELKELISWAEAPENVQYRRTLTVRNSGTGILNDYPVNVSFNSAFYTQEGKIKEDGGDLRIYEAGGEDHIEWGNSTPFMRSRTNVWFKANLLAGQEKKYYLYYGNPIATYNPQDVSTVTGLNYGRGVFLLCHFDDSTECEGNMVPSYENGVTFRQDTRELWGHEMDIDAAYMDGLDKLTYPTSENFNKNRGTIALWFKPSDLTDDHYLFYSEDLEGEPQFGLHLNENGTFFDAWDSLDNNHTVDGGVVNLDWHHLAVTWDNLNGVKIYMDGELKDSKNVAWQSDDIGIDVYVGSDGSSKTAYANMDEFVVYSEALTLDEIRTVMRYHIISSSLGQEETMDETISQDDVNIYDKCNNMLENVTFTSDNERNTVLSLCDSVRICEKTDFAINSISECTFGTQTCVGNEWGDCTGVKPSTDICNMKDDDCNTVIDDVAFPETCACSNGGQPGVEVCNGIDDDCDGVIDNVKGSNSMESTHCGCFNQTVNITQKNAETETLCNGIDDNCNGQIDEGLEKCACVGAVFGPYTNTWATSIGGERCNDIDDDCNGVVDDEWQQQDSGERKYEYLGATCSPVNSRCVGGVFVCSSDGTDMVCSTSSSDGISGEDLRMNETCNAIDDDCNGVIDDVWGEISYKFCQCYNGLPRTEEACDGIDNNCDGLVDNDLSDCGCSFDIVVSSSDINQLAVLLNTKKASGELCNNIDDDCNGIIDDDIEGECFCSGGFSGNPAARPEFCNGIDDDCDGVIDNVAFPETCACFGGENMSGDLIELCDGTDNDCNGLIDEGWATLGSICGMGLCEGGIYECSSEQDVAVCSTEYGGTDEQAVDEVCGDEIDNNCDTLVDENCICDVDGETRKCSTDEGECVEGVQTCSNTEWSSCIGGVLKGTEVCNGLDDDCNGIVDDLSGCGCFGGGEGNTETCNGIDDDCNGIIDDVNGKSSVGTTKCGCYNGLYGRGAQLEVCNRIDDNCDGIVDNVKDGESVPATRCVCYGDANPSVESCNRIDDDCDGEIDEDWVTLSETCGLGICTGKFVCSDDEKTVLCNGASPETEECDSKDNDCDGKIDEGCTEGIGLGSSCENGIQDGDEQGIDCGGACPVPCGGAAPIEGSGSWMIVFAILIAVIIGVGILMVYFK